MLVKKLPPQTYIEQMLDVANQALQKAFGLPADWYHNLDIVKNNYALGMKHLEAGNFRDAEFRFKFLTWLDPKHPQAYYQLARAEMALLKRDRAIASLKKCLRQHKEHEAARLLLAQLLGKVPMQKAPVIAAETEAKILYAVHKEAFPIYWKEKEISDMLLGAGTQAWSVKSDSPLAMLMTRTQFEQAEILTLAVVPNARRKGLAEKLLLAAHAALAASGVKKIFLEVAQDNVAAMGLYRKLGYVQTGIRPGYYKQPDGSTIDALVMSKEVGS